MKVFGVEWGWKMILSHRAPMDPFQTKFDLRFTIRFTIRFAARLTIRFWIRFTTSSRQALQ